MTNNYSNNENIKRRWYDEDTTVSLAVSMLEKTNKANQLKCAELIKEKFGEKSESEYKKLVWEDIKEINKTFIFVES